MDTNISTLGKCEFDSPIIDRHQCDKSFFVSDQVKIKYNCFIGDGTEVKNAPDYFQVAGPREKIFFNPRGVKSAIVTCGGLSPGLNDVIRSIVMESFYRYGASSIFGIRYGYNGLNPANNYEPIELNPVVVRDIHRQGGTILGSSRGGTENMELLADEIVKQKIDILYTIGGDGTLKGAHSLAEIIKKRGLNISIVGIPKTIDNDISYVQRTFGFETAVSKAVDAIYAAHIEAEGAPNGIGLVKLMGRHSGFIAANAALAMNDVNFLLIPEVPFDLYGKNGFLTHLEDRMNRRGHAVICVAEGAGQELVSNEENNNDASGNIILSDVGLFLKNKITTYFNGKGKNITLKYIDPSYMLRSTQANANDSIFCTMLGQFAVHAAMAGKTNLIIGLWNNVYTHLPIELVISKRNQIDPKSRFWYNALEATGQPNSMTN